MKKNTKQGLTNKIAIKDSKFIKKSKKYVDYFINRENEQKFYLQARDVPFLKVPEKMHKNLLTRTWISKMPYFKDASTLIMSKMDKSEMLIIKDLIEKLHNLKIEAPIFDPQDFLDLFVNKVGVLNELQNLTPKIHQIIRHYYLNNKKLVISHNDLIPENILIIEKKYYLIDFEFVCLNHYLFDFASFMTESCNTQQALEFRQLLNLNNEEEKKLDELILYQNYLWAHWASYMFAKTNNLIYKNICLQKIDQALNKY